MPEDLHFSIDTPVLYKSLQPPYQHIFEPQLKGPHLVGSLAFFYGMEAIQIHFGILNNHIYVSNF